MPFLHVNYKRIHYTDFEPRSGASPKETFVFIHGLGSSQNFYSALIPFFTAHDFRCITFDTTGSGRSPYTQIEQSIPSLADDVIDLLDNLKVEKAVVVAHSMGGIVASHLAAERGDRVVAAVLVGPVLPNTGARQVFDKRIDIVEKEGMDAMANTIPTSATGSKATPLHHAFIRELLLAQDAAGYISMCKVISGASPPDYAKIRVPVLIIGGDEDKSTPVEGCKKIFRALGTEEKKLDVLKGVGHWYAIEAADELCSKIMEFYTQIQ